MSTLTKLLIVPALVVAFSIGVALAASGVGGSSTPEAQIVPGTSTDDTTTLGTTTTEDRGGGFREPGEDVRGPCDEAEHANDPRCTGVGGARDDISGPGNADDDGGDLGDDDNSGPGSHNSGPGDGDDDDDDRSGHGGGDDDSSGPGSGGDDDSSGSGDGDDGR